MIEDKIIFACKEHIEIALDDYINFEEAAPQMIKSSDTKCSYCEKEAEYQLLQ